MSRNVASLQFSFDRRITVAWSGFVCLIVAIASLPGCGDSNADQQQAELTQEDPEGEFEWGMKRLERALRQFGPRGGDGLNMTERKLDYKVMPPTDAEPRYTALVTIATETAFFHSKHKPKEELKPKPANEELEIDDPLADKTAELEKMIDIPNTGPGAPAAAGVQVETRSHGKKSEFELAYIDGQWQLTTEPELEHEKLWFEYAFN